MLTQRPSVPHGFDTCHESNDNELMRAEGKTSHVPDRWGEKTFIQVLTIIGLRVIGTAWAKTRGRRWAKGMRALQLGQEKGPWMVIGWKCCKGRLRLDQERRWISTKASVLTQPTGGAHDKNGNCAFRRLEAWEGRTGRSREEQHHYCDTGERKQWPNNHSKEETGVVQSRNLVTNIAHLILNIWMVFRKRKL